MGNQRRGGVDFDAAQQMLERKKKERGNRGDGGSDVNWGRLPDMGEIKIRFLPPLDDEKLPGMEVYKHYNLPEHDGLKGGNITCFRTWGLDCPICAVLDEFRDELGPDSLKDYTGSAAYFNVLILDQADYIPNVVYLLKTPVFTYTWLLEQYVNIDIGDITDPEEGAHVTFKRKKKKGAWDRQIARGSSPISKNPDTVEEILGKRYDLKKIWREPDDNYYNIANDLADQLREIFEDRLNSLKRGGGSDRDKDKPVREVQDAKRNRDEGDRESRSSSRDRDDDRGSDRDRGSSRDRDDDRGSRRGRDEDRDQDQQEDRSSSSRGSRRTRDEQPPDEKPEEKAPRGRRTPQRDEQADEQPEEKAPSSRRGRGSRDEDQQSSESEEPKSGRGSRKGNEEPPEEPKSGGKKGGSGKPAKAPDCFGVDHSDERRCQICSFEYDCENASKK